MTKTLTEMAEQVRLLNVQAVAEMLNVSDRHVYRLADGGRMPRPVKLGGSIRWDRKLIENWIDGGCQNVGTRQGGQR